MHDQNRLTANPKAIALDHYFSGLALVGEQMMDQGLKSMVGLYVGIFLMVGVVAFSTGNSSESSQFAAELEAKTKTAANNDSAHQPFNQVKFENTDQSLLDVENSGDSSTHKPLNIVKFDSSPHQAFNQVAFEPTDKVKSGESRAHQPLNIVRFDNKPHQAPHQAFNVVGYQQQD